MVYMPIAFSSRFSVLTDRATSTLRFKNLLPFFNGQTILRFRVDLPDSESALRRRAKFALVLKSLRFFDQVTFILVLPNSFSVLRSPLALTLGLPSFPFFNCHRNSLPSKYSACRLVVLRRKFHSPRNNRTIGQCNGVVNTQFFSLIRRNHSGL